jgi:hypothetical protein
MFACLTNVRVSTGTLLEQPIYLLTTQQAMPMTTEEARALLTRWTCNTC